MSQEIEFNGERHILPSPGEKGWGPAVTAFLIEMAEKLDPITPVAAGDGLVGTETLDVGANADGSIVVNADDIQIGVLATDAQHGVRGGGTQHAAATNAVAGFATAAQITALEAATSAIASLDSSTDTRLDALEAIDHPAVTIGTANGLSVNGSQQMSMGAASAGVAGAMTGAYATKLDGVEAGATATVAGNGLTSSGSTLNVVANGDGSIVSNANDVQVGILATDAQHGNRGGGGIHADATNATAGFATAAQITKLEGIATAAPKAFMMFAASASTGIGIAAWLYPYESTINIATTDEARHCTLLVPYACKVVAMRSYHALNGAGAGGADVTLRVNGSDTAMTFLHPNGAGASNSTTSNQQTLAAGDRISISWITRSTLASAFQGMKVVLTIENV